MTSHMDGRRIVARTPEQIAAARADALLWRAVLRAGALDQTSGSHERSNAAPRKPVRADGADAQRARFAEAIARAEFGRFYSKPERKSNAKPGRKHHPPGR